MITHLNIDRNDDSLDGLQFLGTLTVDNMPAKNANIIMSSPDGIAFPDSITTDQDGKFVVNTQVDPNQSGTVATVHMTILINQKKMMASFSFDVSKWKSI